MPNIVIDVAAEFTGKKAFDQAGGATAKLERNVKKLAGAFGLAFGTQAVINFSKAAVKAFAEDEAAAIRLKRAVDNLGIGFANPSISKFIADLERSSAIADDILRPAFQALLTTTGSLTKSQELLNNAITISRASGIDLATVSQDLANGYVGITKGLKKYNTGLTAAELTSKSFAEVLGVMLTKSAGAAQDYLSTTQYRMEVLGVATSNASEIIGGGLINAFARIGGGTEASDAAKAIEDIATAIANVTEAIGGAIGAIPNLIKMLGGLPKNIFQGFAGKAAGVNITPKVETKTPTQLSAEKQAKALAKLEADAAKRQKALLALQKKQSDAAKKAAADKAKLDKAAAVFDLQKISIAAALKGKISDEERTRLLLMQAIEDDNAKKAEELAKKLEEIQKKNKEIADQLVYIQGATNPFEAWATSLGEAAAVLGKMPGLIDASGALTPRGKKTIPQDPDRGDPDPTPVEIIPPVGGGASIFDPSDTIEKIIEKVENVAEEAAAAAQEAAASVQETQKVVDELAAAATNGVPVTGSSSMFSGNPYSAVGGPGFGTMNPNISVYIQPQGAIVMPSEVTEFINDAVLEAYKTGYGRTPAGLIG